MSEYNQNIGNENSKNKKCWFKTQSTILLIIFFMFSGINLSANSNENINNNQKWFKNININVEQVGNMTEPRSSMHAVKLQNGNILIFGGVNHKDVSSPNIYHMGGFTFQNEILKSAEIYDIKTKQSIKISDMKHTECIATYIDDDGNIILLSRNKPCQLFNAKENTFIEIYPGIKELPENPYIIKKSAEEILISSKEMNQIIEMNIKTGKYHSIYEGNYHFITSAPINKNTILCAGKIEKASTEKPFEIGIGNSLKENKIKLNNRKINNDIFIYDILKNKFKKIGSFEDNNYNYNIIKTDEETFLRVSQEKPVYNYIFTVRNNHIKSNLLNIDCPISNIYKLSDNLLYLHPLIIFFDKDNYIDLRQDENKRYEYIFNLTGFGKSIIKLDDFSILFIGGNVRYNNSSNRKIYKLNIRASK